MQTMNPRVATPGASAGAAGAWLALAIGALVSAALFAAVVAAARLPGIPSAALATLFGPALVLHVNFAALIWPLAFACAVWLWLAAPPAQLTWPAAGLAFAGVLALPASAALAPSSATLNNYVPIFDTPLFLAALSCFVLALTISTLLTLARWRTLLASPRLTLPARIAVAGAMLPTMLALGLVIHGLIEVDAALPVLERAEQLAWGPGHLLQFTFVALLAAAWLWLLRERPARQTAVTLALLLTILPSLAALPIAVVLEFGSSAQREAFTQLMRFGSWPGPVALIAVLVASCRTSRRTESTEELVAWVSMTLFIVGLVAGALIDGDSTTVPAHYHGTLGALTLALMACARKQRRAEVGKTLTIGFGGGAVVMIIGFALAGASGAARKSLVALGEPTAIFGAALIGVGATAMIATVLWFGASLVMPRRSRPSLRGGRADRRLAAALATTAATVLVGALLVAAGVGSDSRSPAAMAGDHARQAQIRVRFDQGVLMLHARQYDHALTAFHHVLQLAPRLPEAHVNMGYALIGLGRHKEAGDFFAGALELRREQVNAYFGLAVALDAGGDRAAAIGAMRSFVHLAAADDPFRRRALAALWEWEGVISTSAVDRAQSAAMKKK